MRNRLLLLFAFIYLPPICHAEETCPWLNSGTAAAVLGGAVKASVTHPDKDKDDGICEFVREQDSGGGILRIEVRTMGAPKTDFSSFMARCGSISAAVRAIGNEALACTLDGKDGAVTVQIVSRVRDRAFLVSITTSDHSSTKALREKCRSVAEQVAGILF